jgi:hypothetical protein
LGIARGPKLNQSSRPLAILRKSNCALLPCYVQRNVDQDLVRCLLVEEKLASEVINAYWESNEYFHARRSRTEPKRGESTWASLPPLLLAGEITTPSTTKFLWHTISKRQSIGDTERLVVVTSGVFLCDKWWGPTIIRWCEELGSHSHQGWQFNACG